MLINRKYITDLRVAFLKFWFDAITADVAQIYKAIDAMSMDV